MPPDPSCRGISTSTIFTLSRMPIISISVTMLFERLIGAW